MRRVLAASALIVIALSSGAVPAARAGAGAGAEARAPRVVVSVLPLHSLVAGVMAGVAAPYLLVKGASSPHDTALRPSDARAVSAADVIFWIGPALETFLRRPLGALAGKARVIALTEEPGILRRKTPAPGAWERRAGGGARANAPGAGGGAFDPHIWLDPRNAARIVGIVVSALGAADPASAATYRANGARLTERLDALDGELRRRLASVRAVPYIVFHDAYRHFEVRYGLNAVGAFAVAPDAPPGARRLAEMRRRIVDLGVACVFTEPQLAPASVAAVTEGTAAATAALDPLGFGLTPGPEAYFTLMRSLADGLIACLKPTSK